MNMGTPGIRSLRNARQYWRWAWVIRKIVRERGITSIHCAGALHEGFTAYLVKKLTGTPYLVFAHGEELGGIKTSRELTWMTRKVLANAHGMIANSRNTGRLLTEGWNIPEAKVRVVLPGMDATKFRAAPPDAAWRVAQGWKDRIVILTVSRLQKRKGQDMMIRALGAIRKEFPNVLYAIAGSGEEEANLRALAESEGQCDHVQFLGGISDELMVKCYQQCDLFALPNRQVGADFEGFGMVLVEAQACGKPVIAGNSGGTAETMRIPETGRITDCTSPEPLAQTVIELLRNPSELQAMGVRAAEWAKSFDWSNVKTTALRSFEDLLK